MKTSIAAICLAGILAAPAASAQGMGGSAAKERGYVGQMTEEQIKAKLAGEGFSDISEVKKVPVTKYRWSAKAKRSGQDVAVTIDELGHVTAK